MLKTLYASPRIAEIRKTKITDVHGKEHDVFEVLRGEMTAALPVMSLQLKNCGKEACRDCRRENLRSMVCAWEESVRILHKYDDDMGVLFGGLKTAHVWVSKSDTDHALHAQMLDAVVSLLPSWPLEVPDALCADVLALDEPQILTTLREALEEAVRRMIASQKNALALLRRRNIVGQIRWQRNDVCTYEFFRRWRERRHLSTTTNSSSERVDHRNPSGWGGTYAEYEVVSRTTTFEIADVVERHEHQLYNAARYELPAKTVRKPKFVEEFLVTIPAWMRPHVFIVEGDMARETVEANERPAGMEVVREELSRTLVRVGTLYSPAVTIGEFVLTGWSRANL
jgi:hypothetical protein